MIRDAGLFGASSFDTSSFGAGSFDDVRFDVAARRIGAAAVPGDLFGGAPHRAAREYRRLAAVVHPDRVPPDRRGEATAAFTRLADLWRRWRRPVAVTTGRGSYRIGPVAYRGDLATLYRVEMPGGALLKLPRDPANNDLVEREARALRALACDGDRRYAPYVPRLVDSFRQRDPDTGVERRGNVLATAPRLHSLAEVARAYPKGLDPRDAAWMWRRLLVALGYAHRAGVVHGAVLPEHVLIEPDQHGLVLVDWCYAAVGDGDRIPALVPSRADWYPSEVTGGGSVGRRSAGPGTDIAMATRCMTWLVGDRAPAPLARFAAGCLLEPLARRPDDAWRLLGELDEVLEQCFGRRRFRPFHLSIIRNR